MHNGMRKVPLQWLHISHYSTQAYSNADSRATNRQRVPDATCHLVSPSVTRLGLRQGSAPLQDSPKRAAASLLSSLAEHAGTHAHACRPPGRMLRCTPPACISIFSAPLNFSAIATQIVLHRAKEWIAMSWSFHLSCARTSCTESLGQITHRYSWQSHDTEIEIASILPRQRADLSPLDCHPPAGTRLI